MFRRTPDASASLPWRTSAPSFGRLMLVAAALWQSIPGAAQIAPQQTAQQQSAEPIVPVPLGVALDPKRVALGERLFNDVRLSGDSARSCASCHALERGAIDGRARAIAFDGRARLRNTPTLFNVALNASFNWDGATKTMQAHAERLLTNPDVMNSSWAALLAKLGADDAYAAAFAAAYSDGLTQANLVDAIAAFQGTLLTPNARFDRYLRGEREILSAEEKRGYRLFKSYGCVACHQGVNVGGNLHQKFGVFQDPDAPGARAAADVGRYGITGVERDRGVFRVPSLRNVAQTAPYFHDGRMPTLEAAVDTMARVQLGRALSADEIDAIVRFLHTLSGEYRASPLTAASPPSR